MSLNLFARPFSVSVEDIPEEVQMEWIELQRNSTLKDKFNPPVTISLSDRLGHFFSIRFLTRSASKHTTVSQTSFSFFFQTHFQP